MCKYVTIDFETGTQNRESMCQVGIVTVSNGIIIDEYATILRPPDNTIKSRFSEIHGIFPSETINSETFPWFYENEIKDRLEGNLIVAHNQSFDRSVLIKTMEYYDYDYNELNLINSDKWECTMRLFKSEHKFISGALKYLCDDLKIDLNHHDALSDARASATLYYKHLTKDYNAILSKT